MINFKLIFILICFLSLLSCSGGNGNTNLKLTATPNDPFLIPKGDTKCGNNSISAPYYAYNSFKLDWSGPDSFILQAIIITVREVSSSGDPQECAFGSSDLATLFNNANLIWAAPTGPNPVPTSFTSSALCCGGVNVANPKSDSGFNLTGTIKIYGYSQDSSGTITGRVTTLKSTNIR